MKENPSQIQGGLSFRLALVVVVGLWAALYLPCLGTLEMKGEEGRRTLPALAMVESGNWLTPQVGGEPYARKPPLLNWAIALCILVTGQANEWIARLPSVLAVLAMAVGFLFFLRRLLGVETALLGAAMYLVNATVLEKGRIAELESFTITTSGLAFLAWFHGEWTGSNLTRWILSGVCLSLSLLTKGPMPALLFFYLPVVLVCATRSRWRELLSPAHLAGVAITWLPFLAWSRWMFNQLGADRVAQVWTKELAMRVVPETFSWGGYANVILHGVLNFLPWVVWLPLLWRRAVLERIAGPQRALFIAVRRAVVIGFIVVGCLPGARARYTLPLLAPLLVLLAWALALADLSRWFGVLRRLLLGLVVLGGVAAVGVAGYFRNQTWLWLGAAGLAGLAWGVWRWGRRITTIQMLGVGTAAATVVLTGAFWLAVAGLGERLPMSERQAAREILGWLPPGQKLLAVRPGYARLLVYLGFRVRYAPALDQLPPQRPLVLFLDQPEDFATIRAWPGAVHLPVTNHVRGGPFEVWRVDTPPAPHASGSRQRAGGGTGDQDARD